LLQRLGEMTANTTVVLEISHTQLQYIDRSPGIAAITNVTPNHLDQFSWDEYVGLKRTILQYQAPGDCTVLNADDPTSLTLLGDVRGRLVQTSVAGAPAGDGAWVEGSEIVVRSGDRVTTILP